MRIHWVVDGVDQDASGSYRSLLASNRYRAILPAAGLRARGHEVELVPALGWHGSNYAAGRAAVPDIAIIGKILPARDSDRYAKLSASVLASVAEARAAGVKIVADISDDHFQDPVIGNYWRKLVAIVDGVVAGSPAMAATARKHTRCPVAVVGDPLMAPSGEAAAFRPEGAGWKNALLHCLLPNLMPRQRLNLVWYGSAPSWPSMAAWAERLGAFAAEQPLLIRVVTQPGIGAEAKSREFNARFGMAAKMEFILWDGDSVWKAVRASHIVLIPSDLRNSGKGGGKTANRLTDALHCGRFVVASPVPAYAEYGDFSWLGEDLVAGIRWAIEHPKEVLKKIRRGQKTVAVQCSVAAIAKDWEEALASLPAEPSGVDSGLAAAFPVEAGPGEAGSVIRLNLGCGDKPLPGYINVDLAPSRLGRRPDVLCDVRDLRCFADTSADELLSVHVIEHFPRWEVPALLREWVRVLKPGGAMIIECPNLLSACEALLANPEAGSEADEGGQKTMWVLYGDPAWKDPLMTHRWGYTPHSLGKLMQEAGLIYVRRESAQFKQGEPRDMRVVGEKPRTTSQYLPVTKKRTSSKEAPELKADSWIAENNNKTVPTSLAAPAASDFGETGTSPSSLASSSRKAGEEYFRWYYEQRLWKNLFYHGIRILKYVPDMWNYQEIIYSRPITHIVETGTRHGGSAIFFADALKGKNNEGFVVSIDIDARERQVRDYPGVHFLIGDSASPAMISAVFELLPESRGQVFWIFDSDHSYQHVLKELEGYVPRMRPGDYVVVEDTCINGHPVRPGFGPGPWEAVAEFTSRRPILLSHDPARETRFGGTAAPGGYFLRIS